MQFKPSKLDTLGVHVRLLQRKAVLFLLGWTKTGKVLSVSIELYYAQCEEITAHVMDPNNEKWEMEAWIAKGKAEQRLNDAVQNWLHG